MSGSAPVPVQADQPLPMPLVLMYHSVAEYDDDPFLVTVTPQRFDRQLRWLRRVGLRGVSMRELLTADREGRSRGLVGLTFDDGYRDFVTEAVPTLIRYGFSATVFVVAARMGQYSAWDEAGPRKVLLTTEEVAQAAAAGMEIGSQGLLRTSLADAPGPVLIEEVERSRVILREVSGQPVTGFCYPYGQVSGRAVAAVRMAGYEYGCAIWRSEFTGLHALPRTYVGNRDTSPRLTAKWAWHRIRWAGRR